MAGRLEDIYISIHAPARGATVTHKNIPRFCVFQSTLPQGERRQFVRRSVCLICISIHAPARGATPVLFY